MASSDRELVQIEANEDVNSIKDRLSFIRGRRVVLVWPEEGTALTRKLDLVLVQREAMRRQIRLAVVTHDAQVIKNARELNISTFETIGASERGRWKRGRSKVFTNRNQRPDSEPSPDDLKEVASRQIPRRQLGGMQRLLLRFGFLLVLLLLVGGVVYVVVPTATITISPAEERISVTVPITVSRDPSVTQVDSQNNIIPSLRVRVEVPAQTESIETTGRDAAQTTRSVGSVIFINRGGDPVEIPQGTALAMADDPPITFETIASATLPAGDGAEVIVPIQASVGVNGTTGNVASNTINTIISPLGGNVDVTNPEPTGGGQQQVNFITQEDVDRLERILNQLIQARAFDEMPNFPGLTPNHVILDETVTVEEVRSDWISYSGEVGDRADTLTMSMQAQVSALAYDQQQAESLVLLQLSQQVVRGRELQPETVQYTHGPVSVNGDLISFDVTGTSVVAGRVDEDLLRDVVAGSSIDDAIDYINERVDIAPGSTPEIVLSPDLFGRLPIWPRRIEIVVETPQFAPGGGELQSLSDEPEVTETP